MKNHLAIIALLLSAFSFAQSSKKGIPEEIFHVLNDQETAWNNGNIDHFMMSYWKNDSLAFIGKKGITYGWQNTLDNYKKNYPDKATMGQLRFEILSLDVLSDKAAFIIGKWGLTREKGNIGGHFTLLFKKIEGRWVIVSDHTS